MDTKLKSKVIALLRSSSRWWPEKNEAKKLARVDRGLYQCNICKGTFGSKEIQMDHIKPVIDIYEGWVSFDVFIERLFCTRDNYQALCQLCHTTKSSTEKDVRKQVRQQNKLKKESETDGKDKGTNKKTKRTRNTSSNSSGPS